MSVTGDIVTAWRAPRRFIRAKLGDGVREDRALAVLMGAMGLGFVAQWPAHARAAHLDPAVPMEARLGGALMAMLFLMPLIAYALAAVSHLLARAIGGRGSHFGARLALFWALLASAPLMLLSGLMAGLVGGAGAGLVGVIVFAAFALLWGLMLHATETDGHAWT